MEPIYTAENVTPAYQLNWGLTVFWRQPPIPDHEWLKKLQAATEPDGVRILKRRLSRVGLLPDHIHLTLGCPIDQSPETIAISFLNNCAYAVGMKPVFQFGYYVGTIGEYDRGAVL